MEYILSEIEMQKLKVQLALVEALENKLTMLENENTKLQHTLKVERSTTTAILQKLNELNAQLSKMSTPTRVYFNELV